MRDYVKKHFLPSSPERLSIYSQSAIAYEAKSFNFQTNFLRKINLTVGIFNGFVNFWHVTQASLFSVFLISKPKSSGVGHYFTTPHSIYIIQGPRDVCQTLGHRPNVKKKKKSTENDIQFSTYILIQCISFTDGVMNHAIIGKNMQETCTHQPLYQEHPMQLSDPSHQARASINVDIKHQNGTKM